MSSLFLCAFAPLRETYLKKIDLRPARRPAIMTGEMSEDVTILSMLALTMERHADESALGTIRDGVVAWRTWREVANDAARLSEELRAAGILPGDRIAQVSENRYEWIVTDLAIQLLGAVHVSIHVTLSGPQVAEQIADSGARLVFVSSEALWGKFGTHLQGQVAVHCYEKQAGDDFRALLGKPAVAPEERPPAKPGAAADSPKLAVAQPGAAEWIGGACVTGDLATILYTSGTTGRPRGIMLSQANLATNAAAVAEAHGGSADQTRLCLLPLSHVYARTCDLYTWIYRGSRLVLAESRETLARDCRLVQPHSLSAVPFVYQRIVERVDASPAADKAAALRSVFGENMQRLSCGGAPVAPAIEARFEEAGLPLLPGYGLTETSPVVATSTLAQRRAGSVGRPLANVEVRIGKDGEILVRGPSVMLGYWRDQASTGEAIRDGWLHTGDLGELDADGFLYVRGRKKELIALSTGKKVFPSRVEILLTASPLIEQVAVFGEGQAGLVALVVPADAAGSREKGARSDEIGAEIKRCLAAAAQEEQVRRFAIVDRPFSQERGEVTAKMSLCRGVIEENFAAELAELTDANEVRPLVAGS